MSRPWKMSSEIEETIRSAFETALKYADVADGKFNFSTTIAAKNKDKRAELRFTPLAWSKMVMLVDQFDCEVGWDGTVQDLGDNRYLVDDIIVFPQTVTGATVDTDQAEYEKWLAKLPDDTFNRRRFNGHSHVRMGVTPSPTDEKNRRDNVAQLKDTTPNPFWIFMIMNKYSSYECRIYDYRDNLVFDKSDIDVMVDDPNGDLNEFIKNAKGIVKTKAYGSTAGTQPQKPVTPVTTPATQYKTTQPEKPVQAQQLPAPKPAAQPSWRPQPSYWGDYPDDDDYGYSHRYC